MRDVDHIDAVVAELRKDLPAIERRFNEENERFKVLLAADRSVIAHVLKYHLIVEVYLNRYFEMRYPNLAWDEAELRFTQKVNLLTSQSDARVAFVAPGIKELNRIRNKFGHQLDATLGLSDQSAMLRCLAVARAGVEYNDPTRVLHDFATVACTFLTVDPDIERVFQLAFERARQASHPR